MAKTAEEIAAEAYIVIGEMAGADDRLWNHPEVQRALDYFSKKWKEEGSEIIPIGNIDLVEST